MHSSTMPAPPPPYATGSETPSHPSPANCRNNPALFESRPPSVSSARCSAVPQVSAQNLSTAWANSYCSAVNISVAVVSGEFGPALLADQARQIAGADACVEGSDPRTVLSEHRGVGGDRQVAEPVQEMAAADPKPDSRTSPSPFEGTDQLIAGARSKRVVPLGSVDGDPRQAVVDLVGDVGEVGHRLPIFVEGRVHCRNACTARLAARCSESDQTTNVAARQHVLVALVDLFQRVLLGHQFVELQLAEVVHLEVTGNIVAWIRRAEERPVNRLLVQG